MTTAAAKRPLVLLVDDDDDVRALCAAGLRSDYRVLEASNGQQALQLLDQHGPDLVLLDLTMPVMDGWEALRRIRVVSAVPVILVTGHDEDRTVEQGLNAGAQDYLVKPFRLAQLRARVRAALRDHAPPPAPPSIVVQA